MRTQFKITGHIDAEKFRTDYSFNGNSSNFEWREMRWLLFEGYNNLLCLFPINFGVIFVRPLDYIIDIILHDGIIRVNNFLCVGRVIHIFV